MEIRCHAHFFPTIPLQSVTDAWNYKAGNGTPAVTPADGAAKSHDQKLNGTAEWLLTQRSQDDKQPHPQRSEANCRGLHRRKHL